MFVAWLHSECGYRFTGDDGIYALTYNEMRVLFVGFELMQEQAELQQKGVSQHEQKAFKEFADRVNSGDDVTGAAT